MSRGFSVLQDQRILLFVDDLAQRRHGKSLFKSQDGLYGPYTSGDPRPVIFFVGDRYGIFNFAEEALGGQVVVRNFTLSQWTFGRATEVCNSINAPAEKQGLYISWWIASIGVLPE